MSVIACQSCQRHFLIDNDNPVRLPHCHAFRSASTPCIACERVLAYDDIVFILEPIGKGNIYRLEQNLIGQVAIIEEEAGEVIYYIIQMEDGEEIVHFLPRHQLLYGMAMTTPTA